MRKIIVLILISLFLTVSACKVQEVPESTDDVETSHQTSIPTETQGTPTATQNTGALSLSDYFPLKSNIYMKYAGLGNEYAEYETYIDYISNGAIQIRDINPGTTMFSVYTIEDSALKKVYTEGEESYYRLDRTKQRGPEEILIKEPIEPGTTWVLEDGAVRTITSINTAVDVPYGSFEALEITTEKDSFVTKDYYAPGIGLIKSEFTSTDSDDFVVSSELAEYKTDTPLKQEVRLFYPDPNNDKLVYVEDTFTLYTGDNVLELFEEKLKIVPSGSGLSPILSKNSDILALDFDRNTGIVTVDFSSQFISEMNAGSSAENLILSGVANTFGFYFQADKVIITIEGKLYESGHFAFEEGEYLTADWSNIVKYQ